MNDRPCLLDTSAVLTRIEDETGVERVEEILRAALVLLRRSCYTKTRNF